MAISDKAKQRLDEIKNPSSTTEKTNTTSFSNSTKSRLDNMKAESNLYATEYGKIKDEYYATNEQNELYQKISSYGKDVFEKQNLRNLNTDITGKYDWIDKATQEEQDYYYYLVGHGHKSDEKENVENYLKSKYSRGARLASSINTLIDKSYEFENEHNLPASVWGEKAYKGIAKELISVPLSVGGLFDLTDDAIQYAATGQIDNSSVTGISEAKRILQEEVTNDVVEGTKDSKFWNWENTGISNVTGIDNFASFLVDTGFSTVQSLAIAQIPYVGLAILGTEAGASAVTESLQEGCTPEQALGYGVLAGAFETLFEKVSLENVIKAGEGGESLIKTIIKSGFTEGSEEVATEISNMIAGAVIKKDKSEWAVNKAEYLATHSGATEKEAESYALRKAIGQVNAAFLGGAISGGAMSGASTAINKTMTKADISIAMKTNPQSVVDAINEIGAKSGKNYSIDVNSKVDEIYKAYTDAIKDVRSDAIRQQFAANGVAEDKIDSYTDTARKAIYDYQSNFGDLANRLDPKVRDIIKEGKSDAEWKLEADVVNDAIIHPTKAVETAGTETKADTTENTTDTEKPATEPVKPLTEGQKQLLTDIGRYDEVLRNELAVEDAKAEDLVKSFADANGYNYDELFAEYSEFKKANPTKTANYYLNSIQLAETYGKSGASLKDVIKNIGYSDKSINKSYDKGVNSYKASRTEEYKTAEMRKNGVAPFTGRIRMATEEEISEANIIGGQSITATENLTDEQKAQMGFWQNYYKDTVVNLRFFKGGGKVGDSNGAFYYGNNTVFIDVDSDMVRKGLHEFTHAARFNTPQVYDELQSYVIAEVFDGNEISFVDAVERKYVSYNNALKTDWLRTHDDLNGYKEYSRENCAEEVIAESVTKVFDDVDTVQEKMAKMSTEHKNLFQRILDFLKDFASKLKQAIAKYGSANVYADKLAENKKTVDHVIDLMLKARQGMTVTELDKKAKTILTENGYKVGKDGTVYSIAYSNAILSEEERNRVIGSMMRFTGRTRAECERFLNDEEVMSLALKGSILDFSANPLESAIKKNSDYPQGTIDLTNNCPKRMPVTRITNRLQAALPEDLFTADDYADIRLILMNDGRVVACGLCFVEDRRQLLGEIAMEFMGELNDAIANNTTLKKVNASGDKKEIKIGKDLAKRYGVKMGAIRFTDVPKLTQSTFVDSDEWFALQKNHPYVAAAYEAYNNARGQQSGRIILDRAEYKREILKYTPKQIQNINDVGGLRIFSFSDFEAVHMMDLVQIIQDCAAMGIKIQGYTKQVDFVKLALNTGIKLNCSTIPYGATGLKMSNGKKIIALDTVEGIDVNDPIVKKAVKSNDIGFNITGINDEQIRVAMADNFFSYIIPFHSNKAKYQNKKLGVGNWTNYKPWQVDKQAGSLEDVRKLNKKMAELRRQGYSDTEAYKRALKELKDEIIYQAARKKDLINIYTDVLTDTSVVDEKTFTEKFLDVCKRRNLVPRFAQFLDTNADGDFVYTPGYAKVLVDFKLFDNNGNIVPQGNVTPDIPKSVMKEIVNKEMSKTESERVGDVYPEELYEKVLNYIKVKHGYDGDTKSYNDLKSVIDEMVEKTNSDENGTKGIALVNGKVKANPTMLSIKDSEYVPTFYSKMGKVIDNLKQNKVGASDVLSILKRDGVKDEEIKWSGIETFLEGKKSVTKAELQEFATGSMLQIEEEMKQNEDIAWTPKDLKQIKNYEESRKPFEDQVKELYERTYGEKLDIQNWNMGAIYEVNRKITSAESHMSQNAAGIENLPTIKANIEKEVAVSWEYLYNELKGKSALADSESGLLRHIIRDPKGVYGDILTQIKNSEHNDNQILTATLISLRDSVKPLVDLVDNVKKTRYETPSNIRNEFDNLLNEIESINRKIGDIKSTYYKKNYLAKTKWGDSKYILDGGRNYRELLFRLPNSEYSNDAMETHWEESGILAHARIQDMKTSDGNDMLFIEEIQSDWHNAGRNAGYQRQFSSPNDYIDKALNILCQFEGKSDGIDEYYFENRLGIDIREQELTTEEAESIIDDIETDAEVKYTEFDRRRIILLLTKDNNYENNVNSLAKELLVPDAPFKNTYTDYVIKRLLRMASEQGYDSIGWTTAEIQDSRWKDGLSHEPDEGVSGNLKGYTIEYDQDMPKFLNKYGKQWGAKVSKTTLDTGDWFEEKQTEVWQFVIPESMKQSVLYEGQPMYSLKDSDGNTLSPSQQEYFKDSKVRDEDGNLLVVYHGSNADFNTFDIEKYGTASGHPEKALFFTNAERVTKSFGSKSRVFYLDIKNPLDLANLSEEQIDELSGMRSLGLSKSEIKKFIKESIENGDFFALKMYVDYSKVPSLGYDGVIVRWNSDNAIKNDNANPNVMEYAVFNSSQAKLTSNTSPTVSDDIRYSMKEIKDAQTIKSGSLYSGGGLLEAGLEYELLKREFAVEWEDKIAMVYRDNYGDHILSGKVNGNVLTFDSSKYRDVYHVHASPICHNFSPAKIGAKELETDKASARNAVKHFAQLMPRIATVENGEFYKGSESEQIIVKGLEELGYKVRSEVYDSADYGSATSRRRTIIVAVRDGELPPMPTKVARTNTWDAVTSDLWNGLADYSIPDWLMERVNNTKGLDINNITTPTLVITTTKGKQVSFVTAGKQCPTLTTKCGEGFLLLPGGSVKKTTPRFMARIMGLPDTYKFPTFKNGKTILDTSYTIIGNGIPVNLTKAVIGGALENAYQEDYGTTLYSINDSEYLELAKDPKKNEAKLQEMVDATAKDNGFDLNKLYHGTDSNFTSFDVTKSKWGGMGYGIYFSDNSDISSEFKKNNGRLISAYTIPNNLADQSEQYHKITSEQVDQLLKELGIEFKNTIGRYSDSTSSWVSKHDDYEILFSLQSWLHYKYELSSDKIDTVLNTISKITGYDGMVREKGNGNEYVIWNNKQVKSADPVTYDDSGNVIPLSKRFDTSNDDIRYSLNDNLGHHAGDLGKAEPYSSMRTDSSSTGHFGTGTYFVGDEKEINYMNYKARPHEKVDFSKYNMYRPTSENKGFKLHDFLRDVDSYFNYTGVKSYSEYEEIIKKFDKALDDYEEISFDDNFNLQIATHDEKLFEALDIAKELLGTRSFENAFNNAIPYINGSKDSYNFEDDGTVTIYNWDENKFRTVSKDELLEVISDSKFKFSEIRDSMTNYYFGARISRYEDYANSISSVVRDLFGISKDKADSILSKIQETYKDINRINANTTDTPGTMFMKELGYEGIDVRGFSGLDNTKYGSVIYDLKGEDFARKQEIGTARFSMVDDITDKELLAEALDSHIIKPEDRATLSKYKMTYNESLQRANTINSLKSQLKDETDAIKKATIQKQINEQQKKLNDRNKELKSILTMPRMIAIVKDMREEVNQYRWALQNADDKLLAEQIKNGKLSQQLYRKLEVTEKRFQQYKAGVAESKGINYYRPRIEKVTKELIEMLTDRNKKYPLADAFKQPILAVVNTLNFAKSGSMSKKTMDIIATQDALQKLYKEMDTPEKFISKYGTLFPEDMKMWIESIQQYLFDASAVMSEPLNVNDMTAEQLKSLYNFLKVLNKTAKWASKSYTNKATDMTDVSKETMGTLVPLAKNTDTKFKAVKDIRNFMVWDNATPATVFARLGSGGDKIYKLLRQGQAKLAFNQAKIEAKVAEIKEKYGITDKQIHEWYDDENEIVVGGTTMKVPTAAIAELYASLQDEDAYRHAIEGGGITFAEFENGKMSISDKQAHLLTELEIADIFAKLDGNLTKLIDEMHQFLSEFGAQLGNEVSVSRYGIEAFVIPKYYPIKTIESLRNDARIQEENTANLYRMLNQSFTKQRNLRANNAIVIGNFFETFATHMGKMATYNAYAMPVLDTLRWLNYRTKSVDSDGRPVEESVQDAMKNAYGDEMIKYLNRLLVSINGSYGDNDPTNPRVSRFLAGVRMYNRVAVSWNLRVATQQPTSIVRAFDLLNPKYLAKPTKNTYKEMISHSGIAMWKDLGYFNNDVSKQLSKALFGEHGEWASAVDKFSDMGMELAEKMDAITWATLWESVKNEVSQTLPELKDDAYWNVVTEKFEDIIYQTQVVDSVLTKSQWMRSSGAFQKVTSAFKGEPTTSYNMLLKAVDKFNRDVRVKGMQTAYALNKTNMLKAFALLGLSALLQAIVTAPIDAWRDDDDYETILEKLLEAFKNSLIGDGWVDILTKPIDGIPAISDLAELFKGYSVTRPDLDWVSDAIGVFKTGWSMVTNNNFSSAKNWFKIIRAASQYSGFAFANIMRDAVGIWNITFGMIDSSIKIQFTPESRSSGYDAYYQAYRNGNANRVGELIAEMESNGISQTAMWNGLVSQCREDYRNNNISYADAKEYLKSTALLIGITRTDKQIDQLIAGW